MFDLKIPDSMYSMDNYNAANSLSSVPQGLSLRLRHDLRHLHDIVEKNARLALLVSPALSTDEYVAVLARLYGYYRPLEQLLSEKEHWLPPVLRIEPRWPRLQADLGWWGVAHHNLPIAPVSELPRVDNGWAATGVAYVLAGAALGGKIIASHVQGILKLSPPDGMSFYAESSGKASHWQHVREALDQLPAESHDLVLAGAANTFQTLHAWM